MTTPTASPCTCDSVPEVGVPHRPWCAIEHRHPGPDCPGLCEPAEQTKREYKYVLTYDDGERKHRLVDSLTVARAVAESPANWNSPGQPGEVYERDVTTSYGPWRLVPAGVKP